MSLEEARRVLELQEKVTIGDVRQAFRRMAMQYHPDRYQTFSQQAWATRRFIKIKEAYDILKASPVIIGINADLDSEDIKKEETLQGGQTESAKKARTLFDWFLNKFPDENKPFGFIFGLLIFPLGMVFVYYMFILFILQNLCEKCGLDPYPDSRSMKGRFTFLLISTIAALAYLPIFYWMAFTRSGETSPTTLRIVIGIASSAIVLLYVLSEWFGFIATGIWKHSIKSELNQILPISPVTRRK